MTAHDPDSWVVGIEAFEVYPCVILRIHESLSPRDQPGERASTMRLSIREGLHHMNLRISNLCSAWFDQGSQQIRGALVVVHERSLEPPR